MWPWSDSVESNSCFPRPTSEDLLIASLKQWLDQWRFDVRLPWWLSPWLALNRSSTWSKWLSVMTHKPRTMVSCINCGAATIAKQLGDSLPSFLKWSRISGHRGFYTKDLFYSSLQCAGVPPFPSTSQNDSRSGSSSWSLNSSTTCRSGESPGSGFPSQEFWRKIISSKVISPMYINRLNFADDREKRWIVFSLITCVSILSDADDGNGKTNALFFQSMYGWNWKDGLYCLFSSPWNSYQYS